MSHFFTEHESESIIKAISQIEAGTIGELRLHIEDLCEQHPVDRAIEIFNKLGMYNTSQKTGVLIYIATEDHKLAIIGDKGIHSIVGDNFWNHIMVEMKEKFTHESIYAGVIYGVLEVGNKLKEHFPEVRKPENELSNEISYGKI
jgi:uncharacterized membrane protein